eukprot:183977-Chlamydomonas_euryale.AAC.1
MEALMDQDVQNLSGGELQRVAITMCLGKPADIYLIDEPSAYLDSEQRIMASKVWAVMRWGGGTRGSVWGRSGLGVAHHGGKDVGWAGVELRCWGKA